MKHAVEMDSAVMMLHTEFQAFRSCLAEIQGQADSTDIALAYFGKEATNKQDCNPTCLIT
jgi:hypothetical protein